MSISNIAYTMTMRCQLANQPGMLGRLATVIGEAGGNIGAIDIVSANRQTMVRDITVQVLGEAHSERLVSTVNAYPGASVLQVSDRVFLAHLGGKIAIQSKVPLKTRDDLSTAYTPGVARICRAIADDPDSVYALTAKRNSIAVVTDGSAVLGLGNIGPEAALPVMEGKAILFKELADIDAYPIALRSQDPDMIVQTVEQITAGFGGINLEDIASPNCFTVEDQLIERLDIPVMHDDQHGTAVVVLGALINALRLANKRIEDCRAVINGVGAAGTAIIRMLLTAGIGEVTACDRAGILWKGNMDGMTSMQKRIAKATNQSERKGLLTDALPDADIFVGVSVGSILSTDMIKTMSKDAIVFALANPIPEGDPDVLRHEVCVMATGRSDYPNQINNVLSFPGIFRGALDVQAKGISSGMKVAAAQAIANLLTEDELNPDYIIPSVFNRNLVPHVADAVAEAAIAEGLARRTPSRFKKRIESH